MSNRQSDKATFWRAPEYNDMEMLHARYISHRFPLHFHEEYVVGVIERGYYEFDFEGSHRQIRQGEIVLINPGEIHSGYALDNHGWQYRTFYPAAHMMKQLACEITGRDWRMPAFTSPVIADLQLSQQLTTLHTAMEHSKTRLVKDTLLREAMGLLIRKYASDKPRNLRLVSDNRAVSIARDYLETHYAEDVSLDDVANAAALSPYHLSRIFKAQLGLAPHQYLIQIRVQRAKTLLNQGHPIADVALEVGFADQSHLTKWFKRVIGVPPGQFTG